MKFTTKVSAVLATLLASVLFGSSAWACTGVIVGSDLTEDGSTIVGRTEDLEQQHPKRLIVNEAGKYPAGKAIVGAETGVSYTQEKDSLKFTSISDVTPADGRFDEAGFNSAGVAIDATVSAKANEKIRAVDPYTKQGWTEGVLATVLLANATSAKDGIDRMAALIDADGAAEGNSLVVADGAQVWFMEIYSGRQYAAMKYPSDKFSVMPNTFFMNRVDCADAENFVCSKDLVKTAKDAGSYVETDGSFDPARSYGTTTSKGNASRSYAGIKALDPGASVTLDQESYPLLNTPSSSFKRLSVADIMAMQRNRFEGVDEGLAKLSERVVDDSTMKDASGNPVAGARYPVGNTNTMEAHIFVLPRTGMPQSVPGTLWQTIGTPQGSPYLPYYGTITDTIAPMQSTSNDPSDMGSYYWLASAINDVVNADRATVAAPVREYLHAIESPLIAGRAAEDRQLAAKFATSPADAAAWSTAQFARVSEQSVADLTALLGSLKVYNMTHELQAGDGHSVTVAPKQIILPTVFSATAVADASVPEGAGPVVGAWDLALTRHLPNGVRDAAQLTEPVTVTLKVAGAPSDGTLYLAGEAGFTEVPYTAADGAITFKTATFGRVILTGAAAPTPDPSATPTATPTATPSETPTETPSQSPTATPSAGPSAGPTSGPGASRPGGLARTGGELAALALIALGGITGGGVLLARRRHAGR